jgi:hypothetical protein
VASPMPLEAPVTMAAVPVRSVINTRKGCN